MKGRNIRSTIPVLCAFFAALFCAGCFDPLSLSQGGAGESPVLVVRVAGESLANRTALPSAPGSATYAISISRPGVGSLGTLFGSASASSFSVPLNDVPAADDTVSVEALDNSNAKWAQGSYTLPIGYIPGTPVSIILTPFQAGTGTVNLSVSFPLGSGDNTITAAELSLYRSLADYQTGSTYYSKRYRKDTPGGDYGAGEDLTSSIPLNYTGLPSGNYVVKIEFFRFKFVRVSRLVQTIIVRDGLTTNSWDGGGSALPWGAAKFASSNANLNGISIGEETVTLLPDTYNYSVYKPTSAAPSNKDLTVTAGTPGQTITASLNGSPVTNNTLTGMKAANSIVITVTAPDGVTRQTYTVSYTYNHETVWYVDGTNTPSPSTRHFSTVTAALNTSTYGVKDTYAGGSGWPGGSSAPVAARINISGEITEAVTINDSGLPPILLTGSDQDADKIKATGSNRALTIGTAEVILGDGLTLTGGNAGGVFAGGGSSFTMNGGTITGSTGGGVFVDSNGSFTMNGGTISGNTNSDGGGVKVNDTGGAFTMNGGIISNNTANGNGGGVHVKGSNSSFTMNGGTISGNTARSDGGGVYTIASAPFTMYGGSISGNRAGKDGGGVGISGSSGQSTFTMKGGSVSGNTAVTGGGGVVASSNGKFTMEGGSLNGNTAIHGGGVCLYVGTFEMKGGSISGNSSTGNGTVDSGGGVLLIGNSNNFKMDGGSISGNSSATSGGGVGIANGSNTFTMNSGTISGNTASTNGGGVWNDGTFTMSGGTISGNTADIGGGVYVIDSTSNFNMNGGSVSGNTAPTYGGGVYVHTGNFNMDAGTISGNTTDGTGGGVYFSGGGNFTMSGGAISRNAAADTGGGVDFSGGGNFNMSGGAISGNTVGQSGGGVYVIGSASKFNMGGGSISGNTADTHGGGVYVYSGNFTMNTGTIDISGNTTNGSGGGVYFSGGGTFTMNVGTISGNTSDWSGGGVLIDGAGSSFTMNSGTVSGNNSLYTDNDGVHSQNGGIFSNTGGGTVDKITP